eukprot:CAMPEP_0116945928 /NCGR_PEP_ID=MMETSP0467-20121206/36674_1 /TAXON_ID=283647 /ORGANISM="Mesodinium pulex, Strain SPMC105" /LENGTH=70 /DNA_ID=CAMNT_0004629593 /DNA_START=17 /DNA_END=227 /DNA_ORIENTATION=+
MQRPWVGDQASFKTWAGVAALAGFFSSPASADVRCATPSSACTGDLTTFRHGAEPPHCRNFDHDFSTLLQ